MKNTLINWNCQGYRARYYEIRGLLLRHQPLCLSLQETMHGDSNLSAPRGYNIEQFSPTVNPIPGTGLAILIKSTQGHRRLRLLSPLQAIAVRLGIGHILVTICNIYVSPREDLRLQDLMDLVDELPRPFIINGDFNSLHPLWGNQSLNRRGRCIEQLLANSDLCLLNSGEKTHLHIQTGTESAIDLSLCSPDVYADFNWSTADDLFGSDHFPVLMDYIEPQLTTGEARFLLKRADWETFEALTLITDDHEDLSVDELTRVLTRKLTVAANVAIPRSKGSTLHRVPWWTDECSVVDVQRKRALRRYQRTRNEVDKIAYKRARAKAQYVKKCAKIESWRRYVSSINKDTPVSKIWQRIQKMRGKQKHHAPCLTVAGVTTAHPAAVTNLLAEHFANVSSGHHWNNRFQTYKLQQEQRLIDFTPTERSYYNEPIAITEIYHALRNCKNTAPGPDGIPYQMVKKMHPTALRLLLLLYNKIWSSHQLPTEWRTSIVLAFPKAGKPPSEPSSYRPISLSSCIGKLLEKIINGRLIRHLEAYSLLSPLQFGFRRNRGTIDALVRIQNHICRSKEEGKHTICVLFDMHKAYDTTWRHGILRSLHAKGIRGNLALYCREFLKERTFRVKSGDNFSAVYRQNEGVPQGSVLSCTLFLLALDGIVNELPDGVHASLYVDDLVLYASSRFLPALTRRLQVAINRCALWAENHGFVFSAQKTFALHVAAGRSRGIAPALFLDGTPIAYKPQTKLLGLTLDQNFSWLPHLKDLKTRAVKALDILKCLSGHSWGADRQSLLLLYRSLIRSKIDYGSIVYQTANLRSISIMDPVHNAALRLCSGAFRSSPVISLYAECGEPPLKLRRAQLTLQYLARLLQSPHSPTWTSVCAPGQVNEPFPYSIPSLLDYSALITDINLPPLNVLPANRTAIPIWRIPTATFCPLCSYPKKSPENPLTMRELFREHVALRHSHSEHIYTDGSKTGGAVGCAAVYRDHVERRRLMAQTSVFSSELYAIILALNMIENSQGNEFTIFTDSKSALFAIRSCDCCHPLIANILSTIARLTLATKCVCICWVPGHVDVHGNDRADCEAKEAANSNEEFSNRGVPSRDLYPVIRGALMAHWQSQWENTSENKLRELKPTVRSWPSSCCRDRRLEVALCRLRIGHTRLTHGFLMERQPPPYCMDCIVPLTVKHLIAECPNYIDERRARFPSLRDRDSSQILKKVLGEIPDRPYDHLSLKLFLQDSGLLNKL